MQTRTRSTARARLALAAALALAGAAGCGDSNGKAGTAGEGESASGESDSASGREGGASGIAAPPEISRDARAAPSREAAPVKPRALRPALVSGVALAPRDFFDGHLRMLVPQSFSEMTKAAMAETFGGEATAVTALQSPGGEVTVLVGVVDKSLSPAGVAKLFPEARGAMEKAYPDISWSVNKLDAIDGRDWIHLEFEAGPEGKKLKHLLCMTSLDGKLLRVEVVARPGAQAKWLEAMRRSLSTAVLADGSR